MNNMTFVTGKYNIPRSVESLILAIIPGKRRREPR